ncbi:hypothetical protein TNCV_916111 [Trichonephila clavipes]|nr:hypothetical protein TNCV_916111 [Trichonephila clavipes]
MPAMVGYLNHWATAALPLLREVGCQVSAISNLTRLRPISEMEIGKLEIGKLDGSTSKPEIPVEYTQNSKMVEGAQPRYFHKIKTDVNGSMEHATNKPKTSLNIA